MQHHASSRRRRRLSPCGDPLQAVQFSLPVDVAAYIEQLGEGSTSAGLRKLLRMYEHIPAALREQILQRLEQETPPPSDEV
jgi:hypothetical protein